MADEAHPGRPRTQRGDRHGDDVWGRVPGQAPPVRPFLPWLWLVALGAVLVVVVLLLVRPPGPLDQPDLAYQRDGLLRDGPAVPTEVAGVAFGGRTLVLVFTRGAPDPARLAAWRDGLVPDRDVHLVLPAPPVGPPPPVPVTVDPAGELARAVALPVPVDGGSGIGYAIVDAARTVRYSTLDPAWLDNAFEVATVAQAVT